MNRKKMWNAGMASAILMVNVVAGSSRADATFTFDDIHYWVGGGTNRAAVVLDWNNGQPRSSLAWGIRWDGASTNVTEWLRRLAREDRRLHAALRVENWGTWVLGFGYDANGNGGVFDLAVPGTVSDANDFIGVDDFSSLHYWTLIQAAGSVLTSSTTWAYGSGADAVFPVHGSWIALKRINWWEGEGFVPAVPTFAQTPYAHRVVACVIDENQYYADSAAVLGRPSTVTHGWPPWSFDAPVTPCNPAWSPDQLLSLAKKEDGTGGYVVVAFDHRVMDDPQNPFGLDFIVFGNALQNLAGNVYFDETADPAGYTFAAGLNAEPGLVEVSQDGVTWYSYSDGPFADDFAPTMSHQYDPSAPDASLFEGNLWWGARTDPTLPIDPSLTAADFVGRTLAEYASLYNGSAGGTGFDIGVFDLPVDEETGLKWIQYVRVTSMSSVDDADWTEIDAFADVYPASPYDNWARAQYAWTDLPNPAVAGKTAIAANGLPNYVNAAFGSAPGDPPVDDFAITGFWIQNGRAHFRLPSAVRADDAFRIGRSAVLEGSYQNRLPVFEGTVSTDRGVETVYSLSLDHTSDTGFYNVRIVAE